MAHAHFARSATNALCPLDRPICASEKLRNPGQVPPERVSEFDSAPASKFQIKALYERRWLLDSAHCCDKQAVPARRIQKHRAARQLFCSRIGTALLFFTDFARSSFSRESSGKRRTSRRSLALALLAMAGDSAPERIRGIAPQRGFELKNTARSRRRGASLRREGLLYSVDSTGDGGHVGSVNFCDDGTGHCTLRAAIEASNLHPGDCPITWVQSSPQAQ